MHKLVTGALVALVVLGACTSSPSIPSPTFLPSQPVSSPPSSPAGDPPPTPVPSATPSHPGPTPSVSPVPTKGRPSAKPDPTFTIDEQYLLAGIRRGAANDCTPIRTGLPAGATGGVECRSDDPAVARMGFYVFDGSAEMVEAYIRRMAVEGIALDSGLGCDEGDSERVYIPAESDYRAGCFINAEGYANFRVTIPDRVYAAILGRSADMAALDRFVWLDSADVPSLPTLWADPGW